MYRYYVIFIQGQSRFLDCLVKQFIKKSTLNYQQILGSNSPAGRSTTRIPPIEVLAVTTPG